MADDESEFVHVRLGGDTTTVPGWVSREAYDEVWREKGWVIVADEEAALAVPPPPPEPSVAEPTIQEEEE